MNDSGGEASLASIIERSAELKRALVDFACGPRFERHRARAADREIFTGAVDSWLTHIGKNRADLDRTLGISR